MEEPEERLLELVQSLNRRMMECVRPVAEGHSLSPMAMLVLRHIQSSPHATVSDIARRTGIAKSHISNTVELLSRAGFLEKLPDPSDRRLVRLSPTPKAQALGQEILREARRSLREVLDKVPSDVVLSLTSSLATVLAAFEQGVPAGFADSPRHDTAPPSGARLRR